MSDEPGSARSDPPAADDPAADDPDASAGDEVEFELALADPDLSLDSLAEGRALKAEFIANFGAWFDGQVRPLLRRVHLAGGEPQLLVNDVAALLQNIADSIYFPVEADDDADDEAGDEPDQDG